LARVIGLSGDASLAWLRGDMAGCQAVLDDQCAAARGHPVAEAAALTSSALVGALLGHLSRARAQLTEVEERIRSLGVAALVPRWEQAMLVCEWAAGDWASAEARSARLEAMPPMPAALTLGLRLDLLRELGQPEAAGKVAARLREQPPTLLAAWALAGMDDKPAVALARLQAAARSAWREGRLGMLPLVLHRTADLTLRADDEAAAVEALEQFGRLDRDDPMARVLAGSTEARTLRSPEPARVAQRAAEAAGLAALAADCLTVRAHLGDGTLRAARDRWRAIGASTRIAELTALLDDPPENPAVRLTLRERELIALVHAGHTNRRIAEAMHLSVKSVEAYLTRVYAKTGCSSRLELAVATAEGRIPAPEKRISRP
jgi:DNA-binding CsgD family transcriptional regulator